MARPKKRKDMFNDKSKSAAEKAKDGASWLAKNLPFTAGITAGSLIIPGSQALFIPIGLAVDGYRYATRQDDKKKPKDNPFSPKKRGPKS